MDRQPETVGERDKYATLGRAVELGHNQTGDVGNFLENLDLAQCVLPRRRVEHEQRIVRCVWVFLSDHANDFGKFFHKIGAVLQPTGCIYHKKVSAIGFGLGHRFKSEAGGVGPFGGRHNRNTSPVAPNLELLDSSSAECVARCDDDRFTSSAELRGELSDGGGLAGAVDADDKNDLWAFLVDWKRLGDGFHDASDFTSHHVFQLFS